MQVFQPICTCNVFEKLRQKSHSSVYSGTAENVYLACGILMINNNLHYYFFFLQTVGVAQSTKQETSKKKQTNMDFT